MKKILYKCATEPKSIMEEEGNRKLNSHVREITVLLKA